MGVPMWRLVWATTIGCMLAAGAHGAGSPGGADAEVSFTFGVRAFNHGELRLAAEQFQEAVRLDPDDGTLHYWLGVTWLRLGQPRRAVDSIMAGLRVARRPQADEWRVRADLGAAQLQAGDTEAAEATLRGVVEERPEDAVSLYLHGLALVRLGQNEAGRARMERARRADPTLPALPRVSAAPGGELVEARAQPLAEIRIGLLAGTDSNPAILPDGQTGFGPGFQRVSGEDSVANVELRGEIHPFYDKGGWSLGLRLDGFQAVHQDFDFLDIGQVGGLVQLAWGKHPLGYVTGPLGYARVPYGRSRASILFQGGAETLDIDGDSYVQTDVLAGSVTIQEGERMATQVDLDYADQDYKSATLDPFLSGQRTALKASQYFFLGRRDRYVRVGLRAGQRRASRTFDSSQLEASVELSTPLSARTVLNFAGSWLRDDYDHPESNPLSPTGEPREDQTLTAGITLAWALGNHAYLSGRVTHVDRDSDMAVFDQDYDRTIATLGITVYY